MSEAPRRRVLGYVRRMTRSYRLVAFDLYGTLLDISGLAATLSQILGSDAHG